MTSLVKKFKQAANKAGVNYALLKALSYLKIRLSQYLSNSRLTANVNDLKISQDKPTILLFSHDLSRTGAPNLLLDVAKVLVNQQQVNIILLCLCGGELLADFKKLATVVNLNQTQVETISDIGKVEDIFTNLKQFGVYQAILNTFCSGLFIPLLEQYQFNYLILVHELPGVIDILGWNRSVVGLVAQMSHRGKMVFSSEYTYDKVVTTYNLVVDKHIYPQGCRLVDSEGLNKNKPMLHKLLKLPPTTKMVLGCGKGVFRKGVDLFCDIAQLVGSVNSNIHFVWFGDLADPELQKVKNQYQLTNLAFMKFSDNYIDLIRSADLFILTSREDPFPNIVLEMLALGVPTLAYKDCGGYVDLLAKLDEGLLVDKFNNQIFANRIVELLRPEKQSLYQQISQAATAIINDQYKMDDYTNKLLSLLVAKPATKVSVIIPNYNYARYLPQRINSIINQSVKPYEIIFLDDCSSDDSIMVAKQLLDNCGIACKIIKNDKNIGVYNQWRKGIELASGDYIWIAEADDFATYNFLELTCEKFYLDSAINLVYCQSMIVDKDGAVVYQNTLPHTKQLSESQWLEDFCAIGSQLATQYCFYRNIIVNVSSCVFRRDAVLTMVDFDFLTTNFKYCGDWYFYVSLMLAGKIYYLSQPLNMFRKHDSGVTLSKANSPEYLAELIKIKQFMVNNFAITQSIIDCGKEYILQDYNFDKELVNKYFANLQSPAKKLPIMLISTNPSAMTGGGSEVLWQEAALRMQKSGRYEVAICLPHRGLLADKIPNLLANNITIFYKQEVSTDCINQFKPSLVVLSQGDHNEGIDWGIACKSAETKYVIVNQLVKEGWWIDDSLSVKLRDFYLNAAKVFFTCNNNRLLLERQIGAKLTNCDIHYNPVAFSRDIIVDYPQVDNYYLACPGRYTVIHKGQDILMVVMQDKKWRERNLIINCYGDGENKNQLEQLKKYYNLNNVMLNNYKDNILDIWKLNHGIIMPSRFEGIPIVLLTAMLCGRMPIVTEVGGHSELIEHGISGFIAKAPTLELIDEALELAWQARSEWKVFGEVARNRVLNFMPEDPVSDFINKIKDIILC
jgi:glycosyltransferase involved in cell wall biosynthesis